MLHEKITAAEIQGLRAAVWGDSVVSPAEAAQLFDLNDRADPGDRDWTDFFVEALVEYVIARGQPRGFVTDADAAWLIAQFDRDGRLDSSAELEAIVSLFEKAGQLPPALLNYGLVQIEKAVLTGDGPTRRGDPLDSGAINKTECDLLRRMIFSAGGDTPGRVGRAEAEMLFRLKDATLGALNAPEWKTLFVQGVANHILTDRHPAQPSRETALRLDRFMDDHSVHIGAFLGQMVRGKTGSLGAHEPVRADPDDGGFSVGEKAWLDHRIDQDGKRDPLEQALLDFISAEVGER
ncbi:MAG: hypothetical protein M3N02_06590 [Pseudomonadota bacterium]|nr:hypothetical protein [Pseudomonadota bacterium]